jgi:sedoheptulose-bisphosphatase
MRYHTANKIAASNEFGDVQLDMDVQTDSLIFEALRATGVVYAGLSEETPQMYYLCPDGKYIVTFDPLDGSSIIDTNGAVGSIFAIWKRDPNKESLDGFTGKDIVGSALSTYGSRTCIVVYNALSDRVDELTLQKRETEFVWT